MAHKQLYPSYRFHPDGRERIVQTPADDAALRAEDDQWINRPPHGVAHDAAQAAAGDPDDGEMDAIEPAAEDETSVVKPAKKRKKAGPVVDKP